MSTIADNIKTLQSIKTDIKSAITEKGGSVDDTFTSYAQAIRDLPSGGGGIDLYSITDKTLSEINDTKGTITDFDLYGFENLTSINLPQYWSIGYDTLIDPFKITSLSLSDKLLIYDDFIFNVSGFDINKYSQTACIVSNIGYYSLFDSGCFTYNLNSSNMSSYSWQGVPSDKFMFKTFTNVSLPYAWYIGQSAFAYCYYIYNLSIPQAIYIGVSAFAQCSKLTSISLPEATYIGSYAFYSCNGLTSISLPEATYIGSYAFYNCPNLTSISLPEATYIGSYAFYNWSNLTSISLPEATYIGSYAFYNCSHLFSVSLPKAIYIGSNTFYNCSNLTSISLPEATYIGKYAFTNCNKITSVNLPKLTMFSDDIFNCKSTLTFLSIPNVLYFPSIGAFSYLETVNIDKVKTISYYGLTYATQLKSLYMRSISSVPTWSFGFLPTSVPTALQIYVPSSLVSEFQTTTGWSKYSSCYVGV